MSTLYVVATPIGNLNDLSPRVIEALTAADLVVAEDTRVAMKLLSHLGLSKPTLCCHRHNEADRMGGIIDRMINEDLTVALTCDAGTPAISDPGHLLVDAAWAAGIRVVPVSGPSAVVTALSACGFDARAFAFYGFLPRERKPLCEKLNAIRASGIPIAVIYESPHRVVKLMQAVCSELPGCRAAVCCDLTKLYEQITRGSCDDVLAALQANPNVEKGEYCVVLDLSHLPPLEEKQADMPAELCILQHMLDGMTLSDACDAVRSEGAPRNDVYRAKMRIKEFLENV